LNKINPVLKYPGSKWSMTDWIISNFPEDYETMTYVEPFFGSGAVFFRKKLSKIETTNRQKRSLDSNAYCWILCQKMAEVLSKDKGRIYTKEDMYKTAIREVGQFETLAVMEDAAEQFIKVWNSRGLGWHAEEMDSKIAGCKKVIAYYGSSCYDTKAMSVLIDYIVQEAKELNIETMTPQELSLMKQEWGR